MSTAIPEMDLSDNPTGCCPRFDPKPWESGEFHFKDMGFITAATRSFFWMPLNMDAVMTRTQKAIDDAWARPKTRYLQLSRDASMWKAVHYFLVEGEVPGYRTETLDGTWRSFVFEGPYGSMGKWYGDTVRTLDAEGKKPLDFLAFYTTCPNCAKAYGKNYVVLLARVD